MAGAGRPFNPPVPRTLKQRVVKVVAEEFGVEEGAIVANRGPDPWGTLARHVALYFISVEAGYSPEATSRAFGRDHKQVSYAVRRVEDKRDTPIFETAITRVKAVLVAHGALQPADLKGHGQ